MTEIDARDFGAMESKVDRLEKAVESLETKVDQLLALANQGRGAYWAGMLIASGLGAALMTFAKWFLQR
jgi:hypothetical protein